jgi:hypothetical protein
MEVCDQLYPSAYLRVQKKGWWASKSVCMRGRRGKSLNLPGFEPQFLGRPAQIFKIFSTGFNQSVAGEP